MTESPIFRKYISKEIAKFLLFLLLLPNMVLFFLPVANLDVATGYYGIESNQTQFLVSLYYAGFVSFYALERRFYQYFTYKRYFLIFQIIQMIGCFILFKTQNLYLIYTIRFFQGMLFASAVNLYLSMVALKIKTFRAKEVSYSIFFGMLLCTTSFNNLVTADLIDQFNFDFLFHCMIFAYAVNMLIVLITMKIKTQIKPIPLIQLDYLSFLLLSIFIICFGYCSVFGQQYYWLQSNNIVFAILLGLLSCSFFIIRQSISKRPYINLTILKSKKYLIGVTLLFLMYICRFSFTYTGQFFTHILGMDPKHVSYMFSLNLIGIICGVLISCLHLIRKKSTFIVWIIGFSSLFIYHFLMNQRMHISGNESSYFLPMALHGFGVGLIMVPTILYCISSVKFHLAPSAAAFCLFVRFSGYTVSTILINYFTLYNSSIHKDRFRNSTIFSNPFYQNHLEVIQTKLLKNGFSEVKSEKIANLLFQKELNQHILLRSVMDYYTLMMYLCIIIIVFLGLFWFLQKKQELKIRPILPI